MLFQRERIIHMTGRLFKNRSGEKDDYIWNSTGGILNAMQSVVILMVIQRTAGIEAAGIFSIAYATANLFLNLGNYGVRNYQISDLDEQFSFRDYLHHRFLTAAMMIGASLMYCLVSYFNGNYSVKKTWIVFLMCALKCLDCLEEVFEGRMQQRGRLDQAGKLVTVRIIISIGGMIAALAVLRDLLIATLVAIVLEAAVIIWVIRQTRDTIHYQASSHTPGAIGYIMKACFPVCAVNFLSFYITNAPKYAIDGLMDEATQARYNFIAMPVFVIQMLNLFIYQPALVQMTEFWVHRDYGKFIRKFLKIVGGLAIISVIVLFGSWLVGIPALSWLYVADLSDLKTEFMMIMIGSVFFAMNGYYNAVLTVMRVQKLLLPVYLAGAVFSLLVTGSMVRADGIYGAVKAYVIVMIFIMLVLTAVFAYVLARAGKKKQKEQNHGKGV